MNKIWQILRRWLCRHQYTEKLPMLAIFFDDWETIKSCKKCGKLNQAVSVRSL